MRMRLTLFYAVLSLVPPWAMADVFDLWITEVQPSTRQVEVTNVSDTGVTTASSLPFCYRFNYGTSIPSGTHFAPGQSRVYTLSLPFDAADSDLWLYRSSPFFEGANLISGLKWGAQAGVGRTGLASTHDKWSGASDFIAAPANAGDSLQLIGPDPFDVAHWAVGPSGLGHFPEFLIEVRSLTLNGNEVSLEWEGSVPPYQVHSSPTLPPVWTPETASLEGHQATITLPSDAERFFFRVVNGNRIIPLTAEYQLTFDPTWSAQTHPTDFPPNPHFSGLIGSTHNDQVSFWQPGGVASQGIEDMAEFGGKGSLQNEVLVAQGNGTADQLISGSGTGSPGSVSVNFTVNRSHPLASVVTMIAPSPDWFVGVHGLTLLEDGQWRDEVVVNLAPYDAGTDSGVTFQSANADVTPHEPIRQITGFPLEVNGAVPTLGTFTFRKVD